MTLNVARVLYTHTDYSDCWPLYFGQILKHFDVFEKNYVFLNKFDERIPCHFTQIIYNDEKSYTTRLSDSLKEVEEDVIFFEHEDMILLDTPNISSLEVYSKLIKPISKPYALGKFDSIKLINGGNYRSYKISEDSTGHLRQISRTSSWIFSIQPSFWARKSFQLLLAAHPATEIWSFETNAQRSMRSFRFRTALLVENTPRRGTGHFDSQIYPFIATAIVKGKWNLLEYEKEIKNLAERYRVDLEVRGSNLLN